MSNVTATDVTEQVNKRSWYYLCRWQMRFECAVRDCVSRVALIAVCHVWRSSLYFTSGTRRCVSRVALITVLPVRRLKWCVLKM